MLYIVYIFVLLFFIIFSIVLLLKNKALKNNEINANYFKSLLKTVPVCLYVKDVQGNIILANKVFAEVTGYSEKELEKMNVRDVFSYIHFDEISKEDEEILRTKNFYNVERRIIFKGNQAHSYWVLKTPVFDSKNQVKGFIVVFRNIDKEKELEMSKNSFVATLTHDLKTPTNAQIRMLDIFINGGFGELTPKQFEMINLIRCSCKYVSELVSTILETYSSDFGCNNFKPESFDMVELITAIKLGVTGLAEEKRQIIEFSYSNPVCIVFADRLQIKRVIVNLISNAIAYGFMNTSIKIYLESDENKISFSIENKSKQIPESELETLFERFKKVKFGAYNKTGTGLGLYLSKQIVTQHNGEILAKSYEDGRCIFSFTIPLNIKSTFESDLVSKS